MGARRIVAGISDRGIRMEVVYPFVLVARQLTGKSIVKDAIYRIFNSEL